jgi:hypothetical protein
LKTLFEKKLEHSLAKRMVNILSFIIDYDSLFSKFYNNDNSKYGNLINMYIGISGVIMNLDSLRLKFLFDREMDDFQVFMINIAWLCVFYNVRE